MAQSAKWGIASTILAPTSDILRFVAFHLNAGAHRLYIYLDAENRDAYDALKTHPKVRVTTCDAEHWQQQSGGQRPKKHQVRQTYNATHAYHRRAEVDWLIHMDVDEFLVSDHDIATLLSQVSPDARTTRIRPMENLSGGRNAFKCFVPAGPERSNIVNQIYPTYGAHLKGGFLSHLAGKVFVRTGLADIRIQIHDAFQHEERLKGVDPQPHIDLAHCHAKTWEDWIASYRYRLAQGSYRAELSPNKPLGKGGVTLNTLFHTIEAEDGEAGLRAFFDEVCADTPALRTRLAAQGLLKLVNLDLETPVTLHFPNVTL